jgi:hypothetical protein
MPLRTRCVGCRQVPQEALAFAAVRVQSAGFLCLHEGRGEGVIWIPELTNSPIIQACRALVLGLLQSVGKIGSQTAKTTTEFLG